MTNETAIIALSPSAEQTALALVTDFNPGDDSRDVQRARYHSAEAQCFLRDLADWIRAYGSPVGNDCRWIIPNAPLINGRIEATAHADGSLLVVSNEKTVCADGDSESLIFNVGTRALWVQALIEQRAIELRKAGHQRLLLERKRATEAQARTRAALTEEV